MRTEKESMGYAGKNLNKLSNGHVWTKFGVVRVGVFTTAEEFIVEHINGIKTEIHCKLSDICYPVQQIIRDNDSIREKVIAAM